MFIALPILLIGALVVRVIMQIGYSHLPSILNSLLIFTEVWPIIL